MCGHLGQTHTMIAALVETAVEGILTREVNSILSQFGPQPGVAKAAAEALRGLDYRPDLIRMAEAENLLQMNAFSDDITKGPEPKDEGDEEERAMAAVLRIGRKPGVLDRWRAVQIESERRYVELFRQPATTWLDLENRTVALDRELLKPADDAHAWRIYVGGDTWPAALDTMGLVVSTHRVLAQAAAEFEHARSGSYTPGLPLTGEAARDPMGKGDYHYAVTSKGFKIYGCGPYGVDHGGKARGNQAGTVEYDIVFEFPKKP